MTDTKSASIHKPIIEVGTIVHIINAKGYPKRDKYQRWDGKQWVDITEEIRAKEKGE